MKKGFTLIELLIVIAIIGILSVALLPAITSGPARARDAARIAAVNEFSTIMEQYNLDQGGYPTQTANAATDCVDFAATGLALAPPTGGSADIRSFFSKIPTVVRTGTDLCSGGAELIFYRTNNLTGGNYLIAIQVERRESANVTVAHAGADIRGATPAVWLTKSTVLGDLRGAPASTVAAPYYYVVVN